MMSGEAFPLAKGNFLLEEMLRRGDALPTSMRSFIRPTPPYIS